MTGGVCNVLRYKRDWAAASCDERYAEMGGETLGWDAVEGGDWARVGRGGGVASRAGLDGGDHEIPGRVLRGDELEHLRAVPRPLEQLGAQRVRDKLRVALLENAVTQRVREHGGRAKLGPELLLAAGRDHQQRGAGRDALGQRIVGGGVARVQGDEDVDGSFDFRLGIFDLIGINLTGGETEIGKAVLADDPVAEIDQLQAGLDALHDGAIAEQRRDREGEVALAAAHVDDAEGWG